MFRNCILFLFIINQIIFSQFKHTTQNHYSENSISTVLKDDGLRSFNRTLDLLKSPFSFTSDDLLMTGIVLGVTGASFSLDNRIRSDIAKARSKSLDNITYYGEKFGRPIYATILSGLLYSTGLIIKDAELKETGQILAEALVCTGLYTQLLKISLGRARPYTGETNTELDLLEFEIESEDNSLPSGHTSIAFTVATVLSERIDNIFASVALYSLASLTAYQRMYSDVHWFSDTILGAALGTFIGLKLVSLHEKTSSDERSINYNIYPQINSQTYGVGFSLNF